MAEEMQCDLGHTRCCPIGQGGWEESVQFFPKAALGIDGWLGWASEI